MPAQTIITVVAHLCARLLESSAEIRSTIQLQRVFRSFLERTGRGDLVERARAAKAEARARAAANRAAAAAAAVVGGHGVVPFTPPARRGSGVSAAAPAAAAAARPLPEQTMYVSEKQQAHLAAVTIQQWWAAGAEERLRKLGQATAATAVQAAWRGRAAREVVRAERAEQAERERERQASEVSRPDDRQDVPTAFLSVISCLFRRSTLQPSRFASPPSPVLSSRLRDSKHG